MTLSSKLRRELLRLADRSPWHKLVFKVDVVFWIMKAIRRYQNVSERCGRKQLFILGQCF